MKNSRECFGIEHGSLFSNEEKTKGVLAMIGSKSTCMIVALGVCLGLVGMASAQWTAYNDCNYDPDRALGATDPNGQLVHYTSPNVTYWDIGNGHKHASSGGLIKNSDGSPTGVTASLTQNPAVGSVVWQPDITSNWYGGYDTAVGTDARTTFGGIVDMTGVTYYGGRGWWVDLELTGLDPSKVYTFATSAARCRSSYTDRMSIFTLTGADAFTNSSTPGTDNDSETFTTGSAVLAANQVRFITGDNHANGYVARWTEIDPGADGAITIRAEADPASSDTGRKAYAFDAVQLTEIPEPATMSLLGLGALALIRRRRKA